MSSDQCVIEDEAFIVRAIVPIPVHGDDREFEWGVSVSLGETDFDRARTQSWRG